MNMMTQFAEWKAHLIADGKAAVLALLDGTADLGFQSAAEPDDAIDNILGKQDFETGVFDAFDEGCLALAREYRDSPILIGGFESKPDLLDIDMLLKVVQRMMPPKTLFDFHRRYVSWNGFFENFVVDRGLDLRREYYRALSLSQDIATSEGMQPRRLMPLWLSLCAQSGDFGRYEPSYLHIALNGLLLLPRHDETAMSTNPELLGLAYWAAGQRPDEKEFELEWRIRRKLFIRPYEFTKEDVLAAVAVAERQVSEWTGGEERTFPLANWWLRHVGFDPSKRKPQKRTGSVAVPVPKREWEAVLRSVGEPLDRVRPEIEKLVRRQRRYAEVTGDIFYLVRTSCNFGMRLLEKGPDSERAERGKLAASLAAQAFRHDPADVFGWSLMRDALAASGRLADAELVGWEAIRRFPENIRWRTQLAAMLAMHAGKAEEAEALLRETVELFPGETRARALLATVLSDDLHRVEEALEVLDEALGDGVADDATRRLSRKLGQGRALRGSGQRPRSVADDGSVLELPPGAARRQLFLYETGATSDDAMRSVLAEMPTDSYAVYVANRIGLSGVPLKTNFALAFEDALRQAELSALHALLAKARPIDKAVVEEAVGATMDAKDVDEDDVVNVATGADEGNFVEACAPRRDAKGDGRFLMLKSALRQRGGREDRRIILLRDYAASSLSSGSVVSLLAA